MFTYATYPISFPDSDVLVTDVEIRVFASGDDKALWDVQFLGANDRWHTARPGRALEILRHIEANDPLTWSDIRAAEASNTRAA